MPSLLVLFVAQGWQRILFHLTAVLINGVSATHYRIVQIALFVIHAIHFQRLMMQQRLGN